MSYTQASRDLRERALTALDAGRSVGEVAAVIQYDASTIRRWRRLRDQTGRIAPLPHRGDRRLLEAADLEALRADVAAHSDDTLRQRQARWAERTGQSLSLSTISRRLRELHISVKKTLIAREQDPEERAAWADRVAGIDPARFVFLDETSPSTRLVPLWGWGPVGARVVGRAPRGHWEAISLLATLTVNGMGPSLVLPGAVDRRCFDQFVRQELLPHLRPGQIVVLDNLNVHKSARAEALLATVGCELWPLPRYSPDKNPIEQAFSKLKGALRRAEARTFEAVVEAVSSIYPTITAQDACGFVRAAGYFT